VFSSSMFVVFNNSVFVGIRITSRPHGGAALVNPVSYVCGPLAKRGGLGPGGTVRSLKLNS
jgi:hypothetical protein